MIFPETVLADHFVALGSKQAGTRLLVLRQKAAASDNSLGSIRHLLHMYPRPVGAEFGNFFVWCLWEPQHSLSPHTHWLAWHLIHTPASQWAPAAPENCKIIAFPCSRDHRDTLHMYFCLPSLNFRKSNAICSQPDSLGGSHNTIFFKSKWDASTTEQISELQKFKCSCIRNDMAKGMTNKTTNIATKSHLL